MHKIENYRPDEIDFTVETNTVPLTLGEFESEEDARVFMAENLLAVQSKMRTKRFMDHIEIEALRKEYSNELEDELPNLRQEHFKKATEAEKAKMVEKEAKEMVNASLNKIQQLADEVNERTTEIDLDPANTWEVVLHEKRFFYTFIDGIIKLAHIEDLPAFKQADLISSSDKNELFFKKMKKASNG